MTEQRHRMNGKSRLEYAARRNGTWNVSVDDVNKMMTTQEFISNELELFIQVTYSGYTVKSAKLWDFADLQTLPQTTHRVLGVAYQPLTPSDRDKAGRIENVLLGNGRRF